MPRAGAPTITDAPGRAARLAGPEEWIAVLVVLLAFALRTTGTESQSLWYDEGTSAALATRSLATIAANAAADIHPPLYYWLLAIWSHLCGNSVLALRAFSALTGTLLVALIVALGRRLWSARVGWVAGLLAALSPYLVWYSQEVRMYMLASALGAALVWVALERVEALGASGAPPPLRSISSWWLLVLASAALYTHYVGGIAALACVNAVAAVAVVRKRRRAAIRRPDRTPVPQPTAAPGFGSWLTAWLAMQLAAVALFVPWILRAASAIRSWPATSPPFSLAFALSSAAAAYAVGVHVPPAAAAWSPMLAAVAAVGASRRDRLSAHWAGAICVVWAAVPALLVWIAGHARPGWDPKQVIVGAPAFELLLAAGSVQLAATVSAAAAAIGRSLGRRRGTAFGAPAAWRWLAPSAWWASGAALALAIGCLVAPRGAALGAQRSDPAYQRDDYRGIASAIDEMAAPDAAVVLDAPTQVEVFEYYDRGRHAALPIPRARPPDRAATERELAEMAGQHGDIFAVLWATDQSDPAAIVEGWLNAHRYKVSDRWYGNVRLAHWAVAREPMRAASDFQPVVFGGEIALTSLALGPLATPAGGVVTLDLGWCALRRPSADYTVFTQLLDDRSAIVAQRDMLPVGGTARTTQWSPSRQASGALSPAGPAEIHDLVGLPVPPGTPPGAYRLILGLYDASSGERLLVRPAKDGAPPPVDAYVAGRVRVP